VLGGRKAATNQHKRQKASNAVCPSSHTCMVRTGSGRVEKARRRRAVVVGRRKV